MTGQESHIDKVVRCDDCGKYVERIQPHPASQGTATWRHVIPADHVAKPVESRAAHEIRTKLTEGGNVEVWCVCGEWRGTAPSIRVAERDGQKHVESKREDSTDGHA